MLEGLLRVAPLGGLADQNGADSPLVAKAIATQLDVTIIFLDRLITIQVESRCLVLRPGFTGAFYFSP